MNAHDKYFEENAICKGKHKYQSKKIADFSVTKLRKHRGATCTSYRCALCGYYHVGRKSVKSADKRALKIINYYNEELC